MPKPSDVAAELCRASAPDTIVVCGERTGTSRYRIDPAMMQVIRHQEQAANPPRRAGQMANANSSVGPIPPAGAGAIPVLPAAIKVATALVKAAKGEDWREPFQTKPDDYQLYQEAKKANSPGQ